MHIEWNRADRCRDQDAEYQLCYRVFEVEIRRTQGLCQECFDTTGYIDPNCDPSYSESYGHYQPQIMTDGSTFWIFKGVNRHGLKDGAIERPWAISRYMLNHLDFRSDEQMTVVLPFQGNFELGWGNYGILRNFWAPSMRLRTADHGVMRDNHPWHNQWY
jgi:hypothetical protein